MDEYKSVKKHFDKQKVKTTNTSKKIPPLFLAVINRILFCILILVVTLLVIKSNSSAKSWVKKNVYETNFSFAAINNWYQKTLGGILPFDQLLKQQTKPVFKEKLIYSKAEKYKDGVKLTVTKNYLVPVVESGIIVFIGEKDGYGKTIIVQQVNGIDLWYCNIKIDNKKLYDYIEKGTLLGEAIDEELCLVYQKSGGFLDYQKYLP